MPSESSKSKSAWEVIVVGSGLGGMSAAAYAAAAGCRVLVLERYGVLGGCSHVFRRKRQWEFDVGVHYIGDCGPGGQVPTLLHGLGLDQRIEFLPLDRDGFDTIVAPDFELRVPVGWDAYLENLIAAFPREQRALRRYMRVMRRIGEAFDRSVTVKDRAGMMRLARESGSCAAWIMVPHAVFMAACGLSPRAMLVLSAHQGTYGATPEVTPTGWHAGFLQNFVAGGGWYPRGGGQMLAAGFSDVVRAHGGQLRTGAEVERIVIESGRVAGVRLRDGELLRAPVVISNADLKRTYRELVGYENLPRRLARRNERWRMSWPVINSYFGIERDLAETPNTNYYVIPSWESAKDRRTLLRLLPDLVSRADRRDSRQWLDDFAQRLFAFVFSSTRRDASNSRAAPPGCSIVEAMTLAPPAPELWGLTERELAAGNYRRNARYRETKEIVTNALLERIELVFAGVRADVRWSELATPATQSRYTAATDGACYGLEPRTTQFGAMRPGAETAIPGLLLAGTSTRWGTGTEGAMLSGMHAAGVASGRDLAAEVRAGAVISDPSRLRHGDELDPLVHCRRLGAGENEDQDEEDRDANPVRVAVAG